MLQESSARRPFVGKFIIFALIAICTRNYKILKTIRSAARKRNNVINVINLADSFAAIIASTMLIAVHIFNIKGVMRSFGSMLASAIASRLNTLLFWVVLPPKLRPIATGLTMRLIPFAHEISMLRLIILVVVMVKLLRTFWIIKFPLSSLLTPAHSANMPDAPNTTLAFCEFFKWLGYTACFAGSERIGEKNHDNLLKLPLVLSGPELGISVVRRVIEPPLALSYYNIKMAL